MNPDVTYLPKEKIKQAAQEFDCPFFLYSEKRIRENCSNFKNAFTKYFPDFKALCAVKANNNPEILKIIMDEGYEMDASSEYEVWLSKKLGAQGMYTAGYTLDWELKFAKDNGFLINLDDITMIPFLEKIGVPETLSFRINPGIGKEKGNQDGGDNNVLAGPDAKFGIPYEKAVEAYKQARDLGVKHFGVHMMTGSNVPTDHQDYFAQIVEKLFEFIVMLKNEAGIEIEFMNIGGGFGVPYEPDKKSLDLNYIAQSVRRVFDEQCSKHGLKPPRLMAEPGRYLSCDAGWLVSKVHVVKEGYKKFIGICASSNDMPRPAIYGAYHHVTVLNDATETENVSIVGKICENSDQFAKDRDLPKCSPGDLVVIHNCGAHAFAMGHNYNGKVKHAEYLLQNDGGFRMIRRKETFEDLYATSNI